MQRFVVLCVAALAGVGARFLDTGQSVTLRKLPETADLELSGSHFFTISPDDQWLVFFKRDDPEASERPEVHYIYGHLRVMNLRSGEVHAFTLRGDQASEF